jgi:hypothetical protein
MVERVMYLISFYQLSKMILWLKLRVKQKEEPEDTGYNEVTMGRWVLSLSWTEDHLFDARRGLRSVHTLHNCTLASFSSRAILKTTVQLECHRHACGLSSVVRHHPRVSAVHRLPLRLTVKWRTRDRQDVSNKTGSSLWATFTSQCIFVLQLRVGWNSHAESVPTLLEHDPPLLLS